MKKDTFKKELSDFLRSQIDLVEVVSEFTKLRPAGFYLKGKCPFDKDEDEYFTVNPGKKIFYCFNCHRSGDVLAFIAKMNKFSREHAAIYLIEERL